jgi:hypothetical protein
MRFSDFIDPQRGPRALIQLAVYLLVVLIAFQALAVIFSRLGTLDLLLAALCLVCASPVAYLVREARRGRRERQGSRRGAERTPLLPPEEDA